MLGHLARRPPGRVRRAALAPVLRGHAGPPGVQEPTRPPAPALRGVRARGAANAPRVGCPSCRSRPSRTREKASSHPTSRTAPRQCDLRGRRVHHPLRGGVPGTRPGRGRARPTATSARAARGPSSGRRGRRPARPTTATCSWCANTAPRRAARCSRSPPANATSTARHPTATAARELEEEIGYRAGALHLLCEFYNSPGFTDEYTHLFLATELEAHQPCRGERRGSRDDRSNGCRSRASTR